MAATIEHQFGDDRLFLRPLGGWVINEARSLDQALRDLFGSLAQRRPAELVIDLSKLDSMDTAGAFLLARVERNFVEGGGRVAWFGADAGRVVLLERVREALAGEGSAGRPPTTSLLQDVGGTVVGSFVDARRLLLILGGTVQEAGRILLHPSQFRGSAVARQIEVSGVRAVPIILLMSVLIGGIVAQQGAFQLQFFGAAVFAVDLVGSCRSGSWPLC
jgi:phospholipid/cholesterol/gamma-HCH transport system permease protein